MQLGAIGHLTTEKTNRNLLRPRWGHVGQITRQSNLDVKNEVH